MTQENTNRLDLGALLAAAFASLGGQKQPIPVSSIEPLAPLSNEYISSIGGAGMLPYEYHREQTEYLQPTDPRAQQRIAQARRNYLFLTPTRDDIDVLVAANEITANQARAFITGGGGSDNSLGWAQLAHQREGDRIANQQGLLAALMNFQQVHDQRALARQAALREAIPYALPTGMEYYPGFELGGPAERSGLVQPIRAQGYAFDPNSVGAANPYDAQIADVLAQYRALIGAT